MLAKSIKVRPVRPQPQLVDMRQDMNAVFGYSSLKDGNKISQLVLFNSKMLDAAVIICVATINVWCLQSVWALIISINYRFGTEE